jgi:hypothetical protein
LADGTYLLVRQPTGLTSASTEGLSARIDVAFRPSSNGAAGSAGTATVTVTNTGTATLLGSGSPLGGVNIGIETIGADGQLLDREFMRAALVSWPLFVVPDATVTAVVDLPAIPPSAQRLRFDLVAEGVAWLGDIEATKPVVLDIGSR